MHTYTWMEKLKKIFTLLFSTPKIDLYNRKTVVYAFPLLKGLVSVTTKLRGQGPNINLLREQPIIMYYYYYTGHWPSG